MINIDLKECSGCGACAQVCPRHCIDMKDDINGFIMPTVNANKCVDCGLCNKVCQIISNSDKSNDARAYAVVAKEKSILSNSTSGGMFSLLAKYVIAKHGCVYGCAYDQELKPHHIRIDVITDLYKLNGSKYVQSFTDSTYIQVKHDLNNGLMVLYSGTPCQIEGLKLFLDKKYDNLITVDVICHGVPSYSYFKKYIDYFSNEHNIKLSDFQFRSKDNGGWSLSGIYRGIDTKSGKNVKKPFYYFNSYYFYYFLEGAIYRESCYTCKHASLLRPGDFTLGDFWGAEGCGLGFDTSNGCSLVLVNTYKARKIMDSLDMFSKKITLEEATRYNKQLREPSSKPDIREELLRQYREISASETQRFFRKKFKKARIIGKVKYSIPKSIRNYLQKIRYKK